MCGVGDNIKSRSTWQRLFFTALYILIACVVLDVLFLALVILQCGFLLFTGKKNENVVNFTNSVVRYYVQVLNYLSFQSDELPFPFSNFPS